MGGAHNRVDLRRKASFLALRPRGDACSAERLSFACRRRAAYWIDGISIGSRVLSMVFRSWRQSAVPCDEIGGSWWMTGENRAEWGLSVCAVYLAIVHVHEWLYK